jgi:hypothetical protein
MEGFSHGGARGKTEKVRKNTGNSLQRSALMLSVFLLLYPVAVFSQGNEMETKKGCIKATLRAIEMELEGYGKRLKVAETGVGPGGNVGIFKKKIERLKGELQRFRNTDPESYSLSPQKDENRNADLFDKMGKFGPVVPPEKEKVSVLVDQKIRDGVILNIEGMTRSGPFYHVAGIVNDDYSRIKLNKTYELTIYLVYKREYFGFIPDYYVYIAGCRGRNL